MSTDAFMQHKSRLRQEARLRSIPLSNREAHRATLEFLAAMHRRLHPDDYRRMFRTADPTAREALTAAMNEWLSNVYADEVAA